MLIILNSKFHKVREGRIVTIISPAIPLMKIYTQKTIVFGEERSSMKHQQILWQWMHSNLVIYEYQSDIEMNRENDMAR